MKAKKDEKKEIKKTNLKNKKSIKKEKNKTYAKRSASFSLLEVIVIVVITIIVVALTSGYLTYKNYNILNKEIIKSDTDTTDINEFLEVYNNIINSYVQKVDKNQLLDSAIEGMYNYLEDSYTDYLSKEETDSLKEQLKGEYEGIGIQITKESTEEYIKIVQVFENTPASRAGLKEGDFIISVDNEDCKNKTTENVASLIKSSGKENVLIKYMRDLKEYETNIEIKRVIIPAIETKIYDNIGYLKIETFSATISEQIEDNLKKLEEKGITGLVIDVRNNTGGYLSSAYDSSQLFLAKGKIVYQLKDKNGEVTKYKDLTTDKKTYPIAVLINSSSASASEILATALKESYGAIIVGSKSYGKGSVQETESLNSGAMVKYTSSYWLTPKGNSINNIGINPDIEIEDDGETETDEVIQKAIESIK